VKFGLPHLPVIEKSVGSNPNILIEEVNF